MNSAMFLLVLEHHGEYYLHYYRPCWSLSGGRLHSGSKSVVFVAALVEAHCQSILKMVRVIIGSSILILMHDYSIRPKRTRV